MDHNNKKWKKRLLDLLGCLAGLVIIIVLGGASMFRHGIKTLGTLEKINDNVFYSMRYNGDYGFDNFLEIGASTGGELVRFVMEWSLKGLPFEPSIPDLGCSTLGVWTKGRDYIFGHSFDLTYSLALIVEAVPDHGYRSLSAANLAFLDFGEGNLPDSLKEELTALAALYASLNGISEKGLTAVVLRIADEPTNQDMGKTDITTTTTIRLMLDKAATVDETVESLEQYDIYSSAGSYYHSQITDAGGNSAVAEYMDSELVVLKVEWDYQMATNLLLSDKRCNFENGQNRYEILETPLDSCNGVVEDEQADTDLLQAMSKDWHVSESSGRMNAIQWSVVFNCTDLTAKIITGRQYDKPAHEFSLDQWRSAAESNDGIGLPPLSFGSSFV